MNPNYRLFFELEREPFASDIEKEHILVTDSLGGVNQRIHYAMRTGAVALVTGEIGSGKSTALRYVTESLHPSEHLCLYVTATSGSILELYRQILAALGVDNRGISRALMLQSIRGQVTELTNAKKLKVLFAASEAYPLIKTGGLGDVIYGLPRALKALGVDVRVVLPAYREILEYMPEHKIAGWLDIMGAGQQHPVMYVSQL